MANDMMKTKVLGVLFAEEQGELENEERANLFMK